MTQNFRVPGCPRPNTNHLGLLSRRLPLSRRVGQVTHSSPPRPPLPAFSPLYTPLRLRLPAGAPLPGQLSFCSLHIPCASLIYTISRRGAFLRKTLIVSVPSKFSFERPVCTYRRTTRPT